MMLTTFERALDWSFGLGQFRRHTEIRYTEWSLRLKNVESTQLDGRALTSVLIGQHILEKIGLRVPLLANATWARVGYHY